MNKQDLISTVAADAQMTKVKASEVINAIMANISDTVANGGTVTLNNFGVFSVVERKERKGRNPKTGEEMMIPARKAVKFKAGKFLRETVDA